MSKLTLERSIKMAVEHPENTYIAIVDDEIVGFASYLESRDEDMSNTGEIMALYVLKQYQRYGIGKALINASLKELDVFDKIML